ncbi:MAG: threonine ammonia-lyase IlvA, partial [Chitinophagaceae bacterium]
MNLLDKIYLAKQAIKDVCVYTPLSENMALSEEYNAPIWLKREDLQPIRTYKLRGAYNKIEGLNKSPKKSKVVCASAGNHAQGVAYACKQLNIKATIFMPETTSLQKIEKVKFYGKKQVQIVLKGDTFDESFAEASKYCKDKGGILIHPFDDEEVIAGQGTVGLEILETLSQKIDYIFVPIGGGGLAAGICTICNALSPTTKIIGVEPIGAPSMKTSIANNENTTLDQIDTFVDGAAVKRVGDINLAICKKGLHDIIVVPEGKICTTILRLYNEQGIVVEPAGALSIAALDFYKERLRNKTVVCIVSGGNNDITRMEEIKERSLLYEGLKHYFIINMSQRPGALKEFVSKVLGKNGDIAYFQFSKKHNREKSPVVVGIEVKNKNEFTSIIERMQKRKYIYQYLNENEMLFSLIL